MKGKSWFREAFDKVGLVTSGATRDVVYKTGKALRFKFKLRLIDVNSYMGNYFKLFKKADLLFKIHTPQVYIFLMQTDEQIIE